MMRPFLNIVIPPRSNFEAAQPPILIDNGVAVLENEKIERHIMKNIPGGHNLFVPDQVEGSYWSLMSLAMIMIIVIIVITMYRDVERQIMKNILSAHNFS